MFAPIGSHVNENEKKCKNLKIKNFEKGKKNDLEIWLRGSYPQNLAWIHAAVSEKPEFTEDGWTTNNGRLRHDSSSADKVKMS